MKVTAKELAIAAVAVPLVYLSYRATRAIKTAADETGQAAQSLGNYLYDAGKAVNPASDQNLANRAASSMVAKLSGGKYLSIGDILYQWTH